MKEHFWENVCLNLSLICAVKHEYNSTACSYDLQEALLNYTIGHRGQNMDGKDKLSSRNKIYNSNGIIGQSQ